MKSCAFTGHRPEKLPWGESEQDPRCRAVKTLLDQLILRAYDGGCRRFLCGMARGADFYFAEAVLDAKKHRPDLTIEAMLACPQQTDLWIPEDRMRFAALLGQFDGVQVLEPAYTKGCMVRRDKAMVDQAELLISLCSDFRSGTGATVAYARKRGVEIWPIWR